MKINGNTYSNIVYYGGTPIVGNAYRVFVPFGNMSQAFTLIFEDTSPGESGVQSVNGKTGTVVIGKTDIGLGNVDNVKQYSESNPPPYPVTSVNSKTGAVKLAASDVGAVSKTGDTMTGNLTVGSASLQTNGYVTGTWLRTTANTSLGSAASKIAVLDDGWVYSRTTAQIKSDIGLGNVDNVKQYSASNPPPYPVTSVNGQTGDVTIEAGITGTLAVSHGGTGATTAAKACSNLGAVKKSGDTITGSLGIGGDLTVSGKTNGLYIKAGTKVITTTESSQVAVFTSADLNTLFGTSGITWDNTNSVCFFSNGDWSAKSTPICAMFYSGKWRIMTTDWSKFTSGASFRVNYIAIGWA